MPLNPPPHTAWATALVLVALSAASALCRAASVEFPHQFVVNTGTTVPFADVDPIAQSGSVYFDRTDRRMRIDNFWLGNQRSFIADLQRQRGYLISNGACVVSKLTGELLPFRVHEDAIRHAEAELVRGVPTTRYTKSVTGLSDVQVVDFYVKELNFTYMGDDGQVKYTTYFVPWRLMSRRSDRKALMAPPYERPNWRFFGEPIIDELVKYDAEGGSARFATALLNDVPVTVDFYNFVPMVPDATIFEPPATCKEPFTETFAHDVDVVEIERHLMDLSFNNDQGRKLLETRVAQQSEGSAAPVIPPPP